MRGVKEGIKAVMARKEEARHGVQGVQRGVQASKVATTSRPAAEIDDKLSSVETTAIMFTHMSNRRGV